MLALWVSLFSFSLFIPGHILTATISTQSRMKVSLASRARRAVYASKFAQTAFRVVETEKRRSFDWQPGISIQIGTRRKA